MPRIKTTPMVRIALWALRVYLLILLALIGLKFVRVFSHSRNPSQPNGPGASIQNQSPKTAP
ncbi:MAG TPA: hypothetical protein VG167_21210 [Verrucomicrobiae bacterium]|nr:hypothetical protein [Verrucomicrobiae bacterium]